MPTYDYQCEACGHEFELFQQMSDSVKRKCPECSKLKLKRLIGTGAGVIFKGGGFYETDYRSDSYKKAADADKKAAEPKKSEKTDAKKSGSSDKKTSKAVETKSSPPKSTPKKS
ncbi:MAG: zinc ribbon domain-containing protein [Phycisphaerales bacterium]|jgi:putative FmdB family regulatory protein|nr:zinc ribbon domain-containing protein [Phycisphaerales bacterium]